MDKLQQLINIVGAVQTLKLSDLNVDQKYSVDRLKAVDTKLGRRLIAYLDENIHSVDVSDRHVIYKVVNHDRGVPQDRVYIEFCDSTLDPLKYYA
uniref:Uncharacterized protein n=1 Tax=Timema douglasi TaxID=61478 RepID=A0A7R8VQ02_TIMDO|nr:unnamed protein product [Timema douglasi]